MSEESTLPTEVSRISRLEIIGPAGPASRREWVKWNIEQVSFSLQDDGRTLKIFYREAGASIEDGTTSTLLKRSS